MDIENEETAYRFPDMAIYMFIRNMTGISINECKKSHVDSNLETSEKSIREKKKRFGHSAIAL